MAKKATDLLDVFRLGSAEGDAQGKGGASRGKPKRAGRSKGGSSKRRASFEGVFLAPRQLLLVSCVLVLLVVLAFTAGLGLRRGDDGGPALSRGAARAGGWFIRGTLPRQDPFTQREVEPTSLRDELGHRGLGPRWVRVREVRGEQVEILVGPFDTRERAEAYLKGIELMEVSGGRPFRFATVTRPEPSPRR